MDRSLILYFFIRNYCTIEVNNNKMEDMKVFASFVNDVSQMTKKLEEIQKEIDLKIILMKEIQKELEIIIKNNEIYLNQVPDLVSKEILNISYRKTNYNKKDISEKVSNSLKVSIPSIPSSSNDIYTPTKSYVLASISSIGSSIYSSPNSSNYTSPANSNPGSPNKRSAFRNLENELEEEMILSVPVLNDIFINEEVKNNYDNLPTLSFYENIKLQDNFIGKYTFIQNHENRILLLKKEKGEYRFFCKCCKCGSKYGSISADAAYEKKTQTPPAPENFHFYTEEEKMKIYENEKNKKPYVSNIKCIACAKKQII